MEWCVVAKFSHAAAGWPCPPSMNQACSSACTKGAHHTRDHRLVEGHGGRLHLLQAVHARQVHTSLAVLILHDLKTFQCPWVRIQPYHMQPGVTIRSQPQQSKTQNKAQHSKKTAQRAPAAAAADEEPAPVTRPSSRLSSPRVSTLPPALGGADVCSSAWPSAWCRLKGRSTRSPACGGNTIPHSQSVSQAVTCQPGPCVCGHARFAWGTQEHGKRADWMQGL